MKTSKFQKGDLVKIIDVGYYYPDWEILAKTLGAKKWKKANRPTVNSIGMVSNFMDNGNGISVVYLVNVYGYDFLIGGKGITLEKEREWDLVEN